MPPQSRRGDKSQVPADGHGCTACVHTCIGPAVKGSGNVNVNGRPALRVTDNGTHSGCCGPNTWIAQVGSGTVMINNLPAHRLNDMDMHCGGVGKMVEGSDNVITGG
jgi:uncharacterized Zn-binding protein involved in type VI secretion